jgi:hypothetical protein
MPVCIGRTPTLVAREEQFKGVSVVHHALRHLTVSLSVNGVNT